MIFSDRSIWTMVHGIGLGGACLLALAAALFYIHVVRTDGVRGAATPAQSRAMARLTVFIAVTLWLAVLVGTYVIFPTYRIVPPEGLTDLSQYPRALILADPENAWLHAFAMEIKEHVPWIAAMLATAVAFVGVRYRSRLLNDVQMRSIAMTLLAICFVLVSLAALLGTLINKFAPLE
jgi:hypothetical protein